MGYNMGDDVVLNGNGKNGFAVPLALFLVVISGIVGGAVAVTRLSTQIDNLQHSLDTMRTEKAIEKKQIEDRIEMYNIRVINLDKDVSILKDRRERGN